MRRAALKYNIPKSTLSDGACATRCYTSGAPRYLEKEEEEEEELVRWIAGCAEVGCAKNVSEVRAVVSATVARKLGVASIGVSHGCWDISFVRGILSSCFALERQWLTGVPLLLTRMSLTTSSTPVTDMLAASESSST